MIIYKDVVTGDELFTDIYPMEVVDDIFYRVKGKLTTETTDISDAAIGGNASAEGGTEGSEASSVSGVNIILANRLVETGFAKKDYQKDLKAYVGRIVKHLQENNPDRVAPFKAAVQAAVKKVLDSFKEYQFFYGESMNTEGMVVLLIWEGETPFVLFFKDGLEEEKV